MGHQSLSPDYALVKWDAQIPFGHDAVTPTTPKPTSNIRQVLVHGVGEEHAIGANVGSQTDGVDGQVGGGGSVGGLGHHG